MKNINDAEWKARDVDTIARYKRMGIPLSAYQVKILFDAGRLPTPTAKEFAQLERENAKL